ncbi:MAG: hypothetical protein ABI599_13190 [Flavobacteriales bacterium]
MIGWKKVVRSKALLVLSSSALVCSAQPIAVPPPAAEPQAQPYEQAPWALVIGGGWSRRLAVISDTLPNDWQNFQKDQRSGGHLALGIEHWRSNKLGYGLFSDLTTWANSTGALSVADSTSGTDLVSAASRIRVFTLGPQLLWRPVDPRGKTAFTVVLSAGYVSYRDDYRLGTNNYTIIGRNAFGSGALLVDHRLSKQVTIGLRVAYVLALISSFEVELEDGTVIALPNGYSEDVKRVDIGVRLGFTIGQHRSHSAE